MDVRQEHNPKVILCKEMGLSSKEAMKDLEPKHEDRVEEVVDQRKEKTHIGHIVVPKGANLYFFNERTFKFGMVEISKVNHQVNFDTGTTSKKQEAWHDPDNEYVLAINLRNAARKFNRMPFLIRNGVKINVYDENKRQSKMEGQAAPPAESDGEGSV